MDAISKLILFVALCPLSPAFAQVTPSVPQTTSANVLATYRPSTHGGIVINTSDMGLLTSDGVRWLIGPAPPIPPGAALLGYTRNVYTVFPTFADIAFSSTPKSRLYNGSPGFLSITPPSSAYTTASNGQLQMSYPNGGPANQAGLLATMNALNSQSVQGNLGYLPYLLGSIGFCVEEAVTHSVSNPDNFAAFFLYPQEHNTLQNDHLSSDVAGYERWLEPDVNENGLGTNLGGAYRGAMIAWFGFGVGGATTLTAAPGSTGGTIATGGAPGGGNVWPEDTGVYTTKTSTGQQLSATFTNGSATVTWPSTTITGSPTAVITAGYARVTISNVQTAALDYTTEHIFTGCLDPVGQTWAIWQDGVLQSTLAIPATNAIVYTWHYFPILYMQSHGSNVGFTQNVRYIAAWTP